MEDMEDMEDIEDMVEDGFGSDPSCSLCDLGRLGLPGSNKTILNVI